MPPPTMTVLMAVYNGARFLQPAIESILGQSYTDYEFLIINDGSTDNTSDILQGYTQDARLNVLTNETNQGLIASLNRGLAAAQGEFVARMDADDISLPTRLAQQVAYLQQHPEIGLVGTQIQEIDEAGQITHTHHLPWAPHRVRWLLHFDNVIAHPSVMLRRAVLRQTGYYAPSALHGEDYELWARMSNHTKLANLPEYLVLHRQHGSRVSIQHAMQQEQTTCAVVQGLLSQTLGGPVAAKDVAAIRQMVRGQRLTNHAQIVSLARLIDRLCRAYLVQAPLTPAESQDIATDGATKIKHLAGMAAPLSRPLALQLAWQALRLQPQILSTRLIQRLIQRIFQRSGATPHQSAHSPLSHVE